MRSHTDGAMLTILSEAIDSAYEAGVRGAGPARKTFIPHESMQGPASPAADC